MDRAARDRMSMLSAWRRGGAAAFVAAGALIGAGWLQRPAGLFALGLAALIPASAHFALRRFLSRCALVPELAGIEPVARYRRRRCSAHRRRRLATALRGTAIPSSHVRKSNLVAWDRVRLVRGELLALADELEAADNVDPRTMLDLELLLCDSGVSPLLNDTIPERELFVAIRSIRYRVLSAPAG